MKTLEKLLKIAVPLVVIGSLVVYTTYIKDSKKDSDYVKRLREAGM